MSAVVTSIQDLRKLTRAARSAEPARLVGFVPTMGALHDGHLALVREARERTDFVVVSIFVNPLQFGPTEDLDRYPRNLDADLALLRNEGVDVVFAPGVAEMYPSGEVSTRVTAGAVGSVFEGRTRPGHFDGMLTVVSKLLHIVSPDLAFFGQKDAQQVFLVRRMVADLNEPVSIEVVDTVREGDGLALSSRNRFLDAGERRAAVTLFRMLSAAESASEAGVDAIVAAAQAAAMGEELVKVDYFAVVDPATFDAVPDDFRGPALVLVAARVGATRLIDNATVVVGH